MPRPVTPITARVPGNATPTLTLKVHAEEYYAWSKNLRDRDIKKVAMRVLSSAGFKVMQAEKREVKRAFKTSGRPQQAAFVANAIQYQPFKRRQEVWVGPFRNPRKPPREKGNKATGANAQDILADHILGSGFTARSSTARGSNAARLGLLQKGELAVPVQAFRRGGSGKFNFGSVQRGLTREKAFNLGTNARGKTVEKKGFRIEALKGFKRPVLAVRSKKKLDGHWGYPQHPSDLGASGKRSKRGSRKSGKSRIAVKYPYVVPLFHLVKRAKVQPTIRFYATAKRVAPKAVAERFHKEFNRQLKVSQRLGATRLF